MIFIKHAKYYSLQFIVNTCQLQISIHQLTKLQLSGWHAINGTILSSIPHIRKKRQNYKTKATTFIKQKL
jgi:hypothetical protein